MPKSPKPPAAKAPAKKAAAKSAARNTDSGPGRVASAGHDLPAERVAQVEALASAMPHNPTKPLEHGFADSDAEGLGIGEGAVAGLGPARWRCRRR